MNGTANRGSTPIIGRRRHLLAQSLVAALLTIGLTCAWGATNADPLLLTSTIDLPNVNGRIDHLAADVSGQRLFVAALGNSTVEILDLRAAHRIHRLDGLSEPQGIAFTPETDRIVVANGGDGVCRLYDGRSFELLKKIELGEDADNVRYDPLTQRAWVGYGRGALGVIDLASNRVLGNVKLAGHPESFRLATQDRRIFVNVPSARQIAVIDRDKLAVLGTWLMRDAQANFPMALDESRHRLLIGCRNPPRLEVLEAAAGKVVAEVPIGNDTDDLFYDAKRKRIYVSCGEGVIDVIEQRDDDHYQRLARLATAPGARTSLFVPELDRFFLAVPHRGSQNAEIRVFEPRP